MHGDCKYRTVAKMSGVTLSSKVSQYAYTVVCFDAVEPHEWQPARIELAFRALDVQFHHRAIPDAKQDNGVI
jgi:hypothetical protein